MKVLHKKIERKSKRKEGSYPGEIPHDEVKKMRFSGELQNHSGSLQSEVRADPG